MTTDDRLTDLIEALWNYHRPDAHPTAYGTLYRRLAALRTPGVATGSESDRCRQAAQRLIEIVGADGPMSLEDVVGWVGGRVEAVEAALATARRERDEAVENAANAALADAETIETCRETISRQREMIAARDAELARLREERDALMAWRCDVTVALGQPQGTFYADVPKLIRDALARVAELEARDREGRELLRRWMAPWGCASHSEHLEDIERDTEAWLAGTPPADPARGLIERCATWLTANVELTTLPEPSVDLLADLRAYLGGGT